MTGHAERAALTRFLPAIQADLTDAEPRLVFADWLDENGDPHWAELIRVQCRLAPLHERHEYHAGLKSRQERLLRQHGGRWTERVLDWGARWVAFERGFIVGLLIDARDFLAHAEQLLVALPLLRNLWFPPLSSADELPVLDELTLSLELARFLDVPEAALTTRVYEAWQQCLTSQAVYEASAAMRTLVFAHAGARSTLPHSHWSAQQEYPAEPLPLGSGASVQQTRVHISIPTAAGTGERRELPFVIGVLADLSGQSELRPPLLSARRFRLVTRDNFEELLADLAPRLALTIPDLAQRSTPRSLKLTFESLDDFGPSRVVERVAFLQPLLEERRQLLRDHGAAAAVATLDEQLSAQLAVILAHPDFVRLEATWRGLYHLVHQTPSHPLLKLKVLDLSRQEMQADVRRACDWNQLKLNQVIGLEGANADRAEPFALLLGDFEFSDSPAEVMLLRYLAEMAAERQMVFVASVGAGMFGLSRWRELDALSDLNKVFAPLNRASWEAFRAMPEAAHVALTLPRVLARATYGLEKLQAAAFGYSEPTHTEHPGRCVWMSSAWVYAQAVARVFVRAGWLLPTCGVGYGGEVELPVAARLFGPYPFVPGCHEVQLHRRTEPEFNQLGLIPLLDHAGLSVFGNATSCARPEMFFDTAAMSEEQRRCQINHLQTALLFTRPLSVLCRLEWLQGKERAEKEAILNQWLADYVSNAPSQQRPLRLAELEVRLVPSEPQAWDVRVHLWLGGNNPDEAVLLNEVPTTLALVVRIRP